VAWAAKLISARHILVAGCHFLRKFCLCSKQAELIFNPALNGKPQERQQNSGEFDRLLFWMHFCALRSLLIP